MTRFARAKGSKASNERIPEEATPWSQMKKQLLEKNQESEEAKKKKVADKQRAENYKAFLQQVDEDKVKNAKWAEFPTKKGVTKVELNNNEGVIERKKGKNNGAKQGVKRKVEEGEVEVRKQKRKSEAPKLGRELKQKDLKASEVISGKGQKSESNVGKKKRKLKKSAGGQNVEKTEDTDSGVVKKKKKIQKGEKPDSEAPVNEQQPQGDISKFEKKKPKNLKIVAQKKGIKKTNKGKNQKPVEKKPLTDDDLKKLEKKKQKKIRQLEKKQQNKPPNPQTTKKFTNNPKQRRKLPQERMIINGKEVEIAYVDGFPIKKEDAERIHQLRKQMISKGLPRSEIKVALKLERRKAEKAFAREKKKVCFNCRKSGHNLSECPDLGQQLAESAGTGICFKCGSTEHTHFECKVVRGQEFKFAQCFICHEQGHIARQCPDNARGLYPKGGACKVCGDVTHLKRDCPKFQGQQRQLEENVRVETMESGDNPDVLDKGENNVKTGGNKRVNKIVKFYLCFLLT